ncbi:MAG: hypothetical protein Q8P74_01260 [bacterium]|nr:hypothetical protein [bacterium]
MSLINPNIKIPSFFFIFLLPLTLFAGQNKEVVQGIRDLKARGFDVIIVSARPPWGWLKWLMTMQLRFFHVSFGLDDIFLVDFGEGSEKRKLEVLAKKGVDLFFDDDRKVIIFLNNNLVDAVQVNIRGQ